MPISTLARPTQSSQTPPALGISLIVTVFNEGNAIHRLLETIAAQTVRADELVICDGGSTDDTVAAIHAFAQAHGEGLPPLRVLVEPGANISRGRNLAIAAAHGPIITATDAGVRLEPDWLERLTAPWRTAHATGDPLPLAVAGFFVPDVTGIFQTSMAATVLPLVEDIDPAKFLPSSRSVAFTKSAWEGAGGYPEWLDYCEDLLFDFGINRQAKTPPPSLPQIGGGAVVGSGFLFAPEAIAHFQPRTTLKGFWTQYYRYARGDGKADLFRKRHAVRYVIYLIALPILLILTFAGGWLSILGGLGLITGVIAYCLRPWQRLITLRRGRLSAGEAVAAGLLVPLLRVVGDAAKMVGYPVGLLWRRRNRHRPEIHWRE
ncbi:MAG: glycosyltransferase [Caldilineaceae bacterium]|nr:glycosyltransferase [Caldilineaceae bacterium]MBP8110037.1 glycosyltransferase [Caldilineaceae bacterium]MBP8123718.1 glycosyltransferase [Caldilineaceae bacterium]MBP9071438.1 glycosyltransferase [Caldilineaceae bacterium]